MFIPGILIFHDVFSVFCDLVSSNLLGTQELLEFRSVPLALGPFFVFISSTISNSLSAAFFRTEIC